jgi:hypothetical protein
MKKSIYAVLVVLVSVFAINCQREISYPATASPGVTTPAPVKSTIQGRVLDENNQPAANVSIKVGVATATTDARGFFRISKASLDKNASLVIAEKAGYFKGYRTFQATSGANHIVIKLIKKTVVGTINASAGGEVTLSNGAKINLSANGVVKVAGGVYNGSVNVYASYIDPTSTDIGQTIPGSYMADNKDGKRVTLASYGMLAVELESSAAEKLQIASGKTATLTTPVPSLLQSSAPSSISLWYIDEQTGIWKEEGTAAKTGNNYVGDVKHFSFWNCDQGFPGINLTLTLKNQEGIPFVNTLVMLTRPGTGWWPTASGYTDSLGMVSGFVPTGETLVLNVLNDCNNSVYSQNVGPFSQNTNLGTITVTGSTNSLLTINGKVLTCAGAPVTNGYAIIYYDNWPRYVSVNNTGDFSMATIRCSGSATLCDITAVDNATQVQGTVTGIAVTTPVTNAGNILACGVSAVQFINYTLDGNNYGLSSLTASDSLYAYSFQQQPPYGTTIAGYSFTANKNFTLSFSSNTMTPGTYPMSASVQNLSGIMVNPSNVIITNYPQNSGGFFEGSFSGSFRDSANLNPVHTVSGSFRVRRY